MHDGSKAELRGDPMRFNRALVSFVLVTLLATLASAESGIVILHEDGFPAADSVAAPRSALERALPGADLVTTVELKRRLASAKLLVLPYGSAFPEESWSDIY